jgi:hypothetical protein
LAGVGKAEGNPSTTKTNPKKIKHGTKRRSPPDVRINLEGDQFFILTKDKIYYASLDELGEIVQGDLYLGHAADMRLRHLPPREVGQRLQRHSRFTIP